MNIENINTRNVEKKDTLQNNELKTENLESKSVEELEQIKQDESKQTNKKLSGIGKKIDALPDGETKEQAKKDIKKVIQEGGEALNKASNPENYENGELKEEVKEEIAKSFDINQIGKVFESLFVGLMKFLNALCGGGMEEEIILPERDEKYGKKAILDENNNIDYEEQQRQQAYNKIKMLESYSESEVNNWEASENKKFQYLELALTNKPTIEITKTKGDTFFIPLEGKDIHCKFENRQLKATNDADNHLLEKMKGSKIKLGNITLFIDDRLIATDLHTQKDLLIDGINKINISKSEKEKIINNLNQDGNPDNWTLYDHYLINRLTRILRLINECENSGDIKDWSTKNNDKLYNELLLFGCNDLLIRQSVTYYGNGYKYVDLDFLKKGITEIMKSKRLAI